MTFVDMGCGAWTTFAGRGWGWLTFAIICCGTWVCSALGGTTMAFTGGEARVAGTTV
eukprot:CAMPEP_0181226736 /NCGR_PEP_ID=MMETSP1096-20121128/32414_1 /TAXON_ID=156174 ORGANISM="Chrysochromulina ericina, Strain CCMP281" /NCGR_SAMPLE_ID=MMETSP1096 /ASSEMBLY_ACC=CAM_ASM_000453 /LENGTH=56 /DNA_ID=CAMNT_0023320095 /DNA_START=945 /DNA_END=1112 /DNA_ORIENTATION=-